MIDFAKPILICLITMFIVGCNTELARLNKTRYYRVSQQDYQFYKTLRKQLNATDGYRRYRRSQLHFKASEIRGGYGLYYAIMPGKRTNFNVEIPCLISPSICLINTCCFGGKIEGDTVRMAALLDSVLHDMPNTFSVTNSTFSQAELDSLRKIFLYGGTVEPKPGYYPHFR